MFALVSLPPIITSFGYGLGYIRLGLAAAVMLDLSEVITGNEH